eukprot:2988720-Rhodomonas_salina.2
MYMSVIDTPSSSTTNSSCWCWCCSASSPRDSSPPSLLCSPPLLRVASPCCGDDVDVGTAPPAVGLPLSSARFAFPSAPTVTGALTTVSGTGARACACTPSLALPRAPSLALPCTPSLTPPWTPSLALRSGAGLPFSLRFSSRGAEDCPSPGEGAAAARPPFSSLAPTASSTPRCFSPDTPSPLKPLCSSRTSAAFCSLSAFTAGAASRWSCSALSTPPPPSSTVCFPPLPPPPEAASGSVLCSLARFDTLFSSRTGLPASGSGLPAAASSLLCTTYATIDVNSCPRSISAPTGTGWPLTRCVPSALPSRASRSIGDDEVIGAGEEEDGDGVLNGDWLVPLLLLPISFALPGGVLIVLIAAVARAGCEPAAPFGVRGGGVEEAAGCGSGVVSCWKRDISPWIPPPPPPPPRGACCLGAICSFCTV